MFVELKFCWILYWVGISCLPLVSILAHREGWKKFAVGMWEGKFPNVGETMTQNIRSLSYHCGLIFLLHE